MWRQRWPARLTAACAWLYSLANLWNIFALFDEYEGYAAVRWSTALGRCSI
ncbi:MAG: hypothetical protein R2932_59405 [Caldilineaceae bacterium]